jgi:predicted alpha/beta hydrolase
MSSRGTARAQDGVELAVTRFPAQGEARATLVLPGAMGVRQDFYAPVARFFAENGIHVLTFDYRGMGWSRSGSLRGFRATVSDWAEKDLGAMLAEARRPAPGLPLFALGHSLGGQVLAVAPGAEAVRAMVTVTTGTGWYRHNDRMPLQVRFFWFAAIPALTPLAGYFPGKALRMVGDLPAGVAWQWRRWSTHPDYLLCEGERYAEAFGRFTAPILGYSFADDAIVTKPAIDHMHAIYRAAPVERRHLAPTEIGERRLGHFGFFSEKRRGDLWKECLAWMLARA